MVKMAHWIFIGMFYTITVHANNMLAPVPFSKTFDDLSFSDRVEVLQEGYDPFETEWENGVCIKNCAYKGITIQQAKEIIETDTEEVVESLSTYTPQTNNQYIQQCEVRTDTIPTSQDTPLGEPVLGKPRISSPYGERRHPVTGKQDLHTGIDYAVPLNTRVYSTANGVVKAIYNNNSCGKGLKIQHTSGLYTIYCHLNKITVQNREKIGAGCLIGLSGNTGISTGPHLHYAIKNANNKSLNPSRFTQRSK